MIEYVALVNKGLVHTTCDDSILVGHNIISNGKLMGCEDRDEGVFAVADGVGGLPFSELASREILRNIAECNARNKEEIINCVEKGNEKILSIRNQRKLFPNISSTLCIVAFVNCNKTPSRNLYALLFPKLYVVISSSSKATIHKVLLMFGNNFL